MAQDELKRKLRELKKLELRLRFGGTGQGLAGELVWDEFFCLRAGPGKAKYNLDLLAMMDRNEYREVVAEFLYCVYYRLYRAKGILCGQVYDPGLLSRLGLPPDADSAAVKKRFRQLALRCHPDVGGDTAEFIELLENYRKLTGGSR